jgi:hypothetical protein
MQFLLQDGSGGRAAHAQLGPSPARKIDAEKDNARISAGALLECSAKRAPKKVRLHTGRGICFQAMPLPGLR